MRKTVLFLDQQSWMGGAQRVLESTLDSIAHECHCIVALPDRGPFWSTLEQRNVETMALPIGSYSSGRKSVLEMMVFAWRSVVCGFRLAAAIRRRRVALVYINGPRMLPAGVFAAWLSGRPSIFHLHLILERRLEVMLVNRLARRVSRIVACSRAAAAPLLQRNPRLFAKTQVLYNPTRQHDSGAHVRAKQPNSDLVTIGMVGRITERKGQDILLRAVSKLPLSLRDNIRVLIVGSEAPGCEADLRYAEALRADASRYGLTDQIVWAGYQPDPGTCYACMDLMVHTAYLHIEAMCLVILEALDYGIPVIAFRTGGTPEVIQDGENGLLVSNGDEDELSRFIALFLASRDIRERLRAGAAKGLDCRFSMKTFASGIRQCISQVCF